MINIIEPGDKDKNNLQNEKGSILNNLKDENNVDFDGDKVKFPEMELSNIEEALQYVKKHENLLLQKNREKNENVVKEVSEILDNIQNKWDYLAYKQEMQDIKNFLKNYEWDLSNFMYEVAVEWKKRLNEDSRGFAGKNFRARWKLQEDMFNELEWEELVNALKKDVENIDKLYKSTSANLSDEKYWVAKFIYWIFQSIYYKYKKNQNPFK